MGTPYPETEGRPRQTSTFQRVLLLAALPLPILAAIAPVLFTDPMVLGGAADALFRDTEGALATTRTQGLWGAWLWSERVWPVELETQIALFYGLWSLYCGCLAQAVFYRDATPARAMALALALALAPPVADLALVLPAEVPAVGALALHAALVLALPGRVSQYALLLIVPVVLSIDARLALVPLATHLVGAWDRAEAPASLARALVLFVVAAAIGVLGIFALNHWQHGMFGFERGIATPMVEGEDRLALIGTWIAELGSYLFGPLALAGVAAAVAAFAALFWYDPPQADRVFGALVLGLLLLFVQALLSGLPPTRPGLLFLWVLLIGALATAGRAAPSSVIATIFAIGLLSAAAAGGIRWHAVHGAGGALSAGIQVLAADIRQGIGEGPAPERMVIAGSPSEIEGGEALREFGQLAIRLRRVTGIPAVQCPGEGAPCDRHRARLATMPARPEEGWIARAEDGSLLLRLPDGVFIPARER